MYSIIAGVIILSVSILLILLCCRWSRKPIEEDHCVEHGAIRRKECGCIEKYDCNWVTTGKCQLHKDPVVDGNP